MWITKKYLLMGKSKNRRTMHIVCYHLCPKERRFIEKYIFSHRNTNPYPRQSIVCESLKNTDETRHAVCLLGGELGG